MRSALLLSAALAAGCIVENTPEDVVRQVVDAGYTRNCTEVIALYLPGTHGRHPCTTEFMDELVTIAPLVDRQLQMYGVEVQEDIDDYGYVAYECGGAYECNLTTELWDNRWYLGDINDQSDY